MYFKENQDGSIDVADVIAILNMFNIDLYPDMEKFPITSYSGKKKCIDTYIKYHKEYGDNKNNPYVKMEAIDVYKRQIYIQSAGKIALRIKIYPKDFFIHFSKTCR